eukprot:9499826-Pyramimonas_sp.AAC.1
MDGSLDCKADGYGWLCGWLLGWLLMVIQMVIGCSPSSARRNITPYALESNAEETSVLVLALAHELYNALPCCLRVLGPGEQLIYPMASGQAAPSLRVDARVNATAAIHHRPWIRLGHAWELQAGGFAESLQRFHCGGRRG